MMKKLAAFALTGLVLAGCTSSNSQTYSSREVGQAIDTSRGTVVSSQPVKISGEPTLAGPAIGGVAGASAGSLSMGGGGIVTVLGGLAGAGIGYLSERQLRSGEGIEYIVEMEDGRTVTIVQNVESDEPAITSGTEVLVQRGNQYSRVIPVPSSYDPGGAGGWVDPDTIDTDPTPAEAYGGPKPSDLFAPLPDQ